MTTTNARRYTAEFKRDAVERLGAGDKSLVAVADQFGVSPATLRNWAKAASSEVVSPAALLPPEGPNGCNFCGREPTAAFKMRSGQGLVLMSRWRTVKGRFCRECAHSVAQFELNRTMTQGWFGLVSFFLNWYAVAVDVYALWKAKRLPAPEGMLRRPPFPPGRPLYERAGIYVTAAAIGVALVAVLT